MTKANPSNPHTRDPGTTQRDVPMPVSKARVVESKDHPDEFGFHSIKIRVYGDSAVYQAPVITPMHGTVTVPSEGEDVAVIFGNDDKPIVIGSWYAIDRVDDGDVNLPEYDSGDIRIGNGSNSNLTIFDDGSIQLVTDKSEPVNIDHHNAVAFMSADQDVPGDDMYYKLDFDTAHKNADGLLDTSTQSLTIRDGGQHTIDVTIEVPIPNENKAYTLALFKNGSLFKRKSAQSSVKDPVSIEVRTTRDFSTDDEIDARLKHDDSNNNVATINSNDAATEFTIHRRGL